MIIVETFGKRLSVCEVRGPVRVVWLMITTPDDVASVFAKKYQELYTSADFEKVDMKTVRNEIDVAVSSVGINGDCVISC